MFSTNTPNKPLTLHQMQAFSRAPKKTARKLRRTQTDPAAASLGILKAHTHMAKLKKRESTIKSPKKSRSAPRRCMTFDDTFLSKNRRRSSLESTCTATTCSSTGSSRRGLDCSDHCGRVVPVRTEPGPSILKKANASTDGSLLPIPEDSSRRRIPSHMRVAFDVTETRDYPLLFDDSRHDGPAMLTLDWNYQVGDVSTVQEFDFNRAYHRQNTGGSVRVWQPAERIVLLLEAGYKLHELTVDQPQQEQHDPEYIQETLKTVHPKKKNKIFKKVKKVASKTIGRTSRRRSMDVEVTTSIDVELM